MFVLRGHSTSLRMKRFIPFMKSDPLVSVIRLSGAIGAGSRMPLSDEALAPQIEKAFKRGKPKAVALLINSPGGSPVQSALIAGRIRRLAEGIVLRRHNTQAFILCLRRCHRHLRVPLDLYFRW